MPANPILVAAVVFSVIIIIVIIILVVMLTRKPVAVKVTPPPPTTDTTGAADIPPVSLAEQAAATTHPPPTTRVSTTSTTSTPTSPTTNQTTSTSAPVLLLANGERVDGRCGTMFGGAKCGVNRCCSKTGYCGSVDKTCSPTVNDPVFNGPVEYLPTGERTDYRCGPLALGAKCGTNRCCSKAGWCGSPGEIACTATMNIPLYNGPGLVL